MTKVLEQVHYVFQGLEYVIMMTEEDKHYKSHICEDCQFDNTSKCSNFGGCSGVGNRDRTEYNRFKVILKPKEVKPVEVSVEQKEWIDILL